MWKPFLLAAVALSLIAASINPKDEAWIGARRSYWAFQPVVRPAVPKVSANPIDAFLLEQLQAKGLSSSPPLDKAHLVRRVTLDLTGLPPTAAEVQRFLSDRSPKAYEQLVERLLASPAYGERWALRWLDTVRYADTNGYELDAERPQAWRYRDYVVNSFNANKPYDRFLKEQIAGDELYPGDQPALIATGFHRAGPIHLVGGNQDEEMNRQEVLTEMTLGVSNVFLGMTVGCARCHNHKFDPILQADYYRLQAIFASVSLKDSEIFTPDEKATHETAMKAFEARLKPITDEIAAIERPVRERIKEERKAKLEKRFLDAMAIPKDKRTPEQEVVAKEGNKQITPTWDVVVNAIEPSEKARRAGLRQQMHKLEFERPEPLRTAYAVANLDKAPVTHMLKLGDHRYKLDPVEPGFLTALGAVDAPAGPTGRRAALAEWLARPEHPLTARVMANRIWLLRMGSGIVPTPNDFGILGGKASNRKLLDWLAAEFVSSGWDIKHMDRLIVSTAAYRQSADIDAKKAAIDGDNKYYWRMNRRRLEGEAIRDSILQTTGQLNVRLGGVPVKVPIEPEIYDIIFTEAEPDNLWPVLADKREHNRRSLYLLNKRTVRLPLLNNFDQPDAVSSCPVRANSTHALQALTLLNSDFVFDQATAFAARLEPGCSTPQCRISRAYELALQRAPKPAEMQLALDFLNRQKMPLTDFCRALLNRHEFVYIP